jgi:glycosyltransferase involved in cell wall biosynthesis
MKVAFISLIPYDTYSEDLIRNHSEDPDFFDREILANHSDPVHKWCKMLLDKGIKIEFWYLSRYSSNVKAFRHKYGHETRRIPSFNTKKIFSRYFENEISFSLFKELKRNKISHVLLLNYLQNKRILIDFSDMLIIFCRRNGIKIFPIYGGDSIDNYPLVKKRLKNSFLKMTNELLCQSRREINLMVDKLKFPGEKAHYFLNPLDLQFFYPISKDQAIRQLGLSSSSKYLLYIGRFEYGKGIHHIINIMHVILERHPNIVFIMMGKGGYLTELRKLINDLALTEKIIIKEPVENNKLLFYYNIADIL